MWHENEGAPPHTNRHGYQVPDVTFKDPNNRKMRVVTIGTGFSGILIAYRLSRELQNFELTIYEKNGDIGGTWLENRYPNCACDVPSHSYTYEFALNPFWPELYSKSNDIWIYLDRVCRAFDLRKYMQFNTKLLSAKWSQDEGLWHLKLQRTYADESTEIIEDYCHVLLQATGLLNNLRMPTIEGIDSFKGRIVHTAQWPQDYGPEQWEGKNFVVIGAGSSSVQTTPGLQQHAKHVDLFARSKTWLASAQPDNLAKPYFTKEEQQEFQNDKSKLLNQARLYEVNVNMVWKAMLANSAEQAGLVERSSAKMRTHLQKPGLVEGFLPGFAVGCRRTTPGVSFMKALNEPNVDTHFTSVVKITPDGVIGADGTEVHGIDTIVCATGFDTSYRPNFDIIGQEGISLSQKFDPNPDSYLSISAPGFPNYVLFFGPTFPVLAGSVTASLNAVTDFAIKMIQKIQTEDIRSISPKQDVTDAFNVHVQTALHGFVWEDNCSSWYTRRDGRTTAVWPGSALHYQDVIRHPRWEDWNVQYMSKHNMWSYLGLGFTMIERDPEADRAPYLKLERLDPRFYDTETTPLYEGRAPTAHEARMRSLQQRSDGAANGKAEANGTVADGGTGLDDLSGSLNYRDEVEKKDDKAEGGGLAV